MKAQHNLKWFTESELTDVDSNSSSPTEALVAWEAEFLCLLG